MDPSGYFPETAVSNYKQVDITGRGCCSFGHGTEYENKLRCTVCKSLFQKTDRPFRFQDEIAQHRIELMTGIGGEIDPVSVLFCGNQSQFGHLPQFSLQHGGT